MRRIQASALAMSVALMGCVGTIDAPPPATSEAEADPTAAADLLYVWAFDTDQQSSDFLSVIELDESSQDYGRILTTLPVGLVGGAHHTEHRLSDEGVLFANAFAAGTTFLFDVTAPTSPAMVGSFEGRGPYTFPHSFERLPNGNLLSTFQNKGDGNLEPGGLVELSRTGEFLRGSDAGAPGVPENIRPYSLTLLPELDRVVTTTADMRGQLLPDAVQLWSLSELELLTTLRLPPGPRGDENLMPAEPRFLEDKRRVVVNTFSCGLYLLSDLEEETPEVRHLLTFPYEPPHRCALAVRIGRYWVQTVPTSEALVSVDLEDPTRAAIVGELHLGENFRPHWIAADSAGERIVVTGRGDMEHRVLLVDLDPATGQMALDSRFRDAGSNLPGITFDRESWPHGATGTATPHGSVFRR